MIPKRTKTNQTKVGGISLSSDEAEIQDPGKKTDFWKQPHGLHQWSIQTGFGDTSSEVIPQRMT